MKGSHWEDLTKKRKTWRKKIEVLMENMTYSILPSGCSGTSRTLHGCTLDDCSSSNVTTPIQ
jgi:hypothetical protein